tara:strand:+ start:550 stop:864 length:315 start_codon:yes stop_codon:yes gene_type:complete
LFNDIEEKIHIPYAELTHSRAIIWVRVKTPFVTAPGLQILVIFTLTPNIGVTPNIGGAAQRSGASHTNDLLEGIIAQVPPVLYELTEQQFRIHLVVAHQCIVLL